MTDPYWNDPMRSNYDFAGRFVATPFAFMNTSYPQGQNPYATAHVRGLVRSLLCPVSTPDLHLSRKMIEVTPGNFVEHILVNVAGNTNETASLNGNYEVESGIASGTQSGRFQNSFGLTTRYNPQYQVGT